MEKDILSIEELTRIEVQRLKNRQVNWTLDNVKCLLDSYNKTMYPKHEALSKEIIDFMVNIREGDMAVNGNYAIRRRELEEAFLQGQKSIVDLRNFDALAEYLEEENIPTYQEYLKTLGSAGEAKPKLKSYNECKNNNVQSGSTEEINKGS